MEELADTIVIFLTIVCAVYLAVQTDLIIIDISESLNRIYEILMSR